MKKLDDYTKQELVALILISHNTAKELKTIATFAIKDDLPMGTLLRIEMIECLLKELENA